jgi:tRNA-guanine family transglycosylase
MSWNGPILTDSDAVEAGVSPANSNTATDTAATTARQLLLGIVQGATFDDLRKQNGQALSILISDYAIGGVSVGEPEEASHRWCRRTRSGQDRAERARAEFTGAT